MTVQLMKTLLGLALLGFLTANPAMAGVDEDDRIWLNLTMQGDLPTENFRWYAEIQPRIRDGGGAMDSLLLRPAISYKLNDATSLWVGYGHIYSYPESGEVIDEDRLWQQILHTFSPIRGITLSSRTRLEERRVETGDDTGYRLRQTLRATWPWALHSGLNLVIWDEYFLNANDTDWGARSGFDQNRAFAGVSFAFDKQFTVETGYLNQYVRARGDDRMNHVFSTTLLVNF